MENPECYVLVLNIPQTFHSADLRSFFSSFIENGKCFEYFHFRHRPQAEFVKELHLQSRVALNKPQPRQTISKLLSKDAVCAIIKCYETSSKSAFLRKYHLENWVTGADVMLAERCILVDVSPVHETLSLPVETLTIAQTVIKFQVSHDTLRTMVEFSPPALMPQGNVGTPTLHFKALVQKCQLPSKIIQKLGLKFSKQKLRKYGSVPYDYQTYASYENKNPDFFSEDNTIKSQSEEHSIDDVEEWDRHLELHDNVDEQSRAKERLYEEEMEVVWEKGGPGLVWYTDAQYWKQYDGDFDEETSDDWDVDFSVYYEDNGGDKDAKDAVEMRQSNLWRLEGCDSVFNFKRPYPLKRSFKTKTQTRRLLGSFESHTRGIGRRLLEKQGWKDGLGLGKTQKGIALPLEHDGQKPRERKGLGYYGNLTQSSRHGRNPQSREIKSSTVYDHHSTTDREIKISTVYDHHSTTDPPETLLRRNPPTHMKYRL